MKQAIEEWPICDCLLAWYSKGFPLEKCRAYVQLRRPYQVNTVSSQHLLLDRRKVYSRCQEFDIPLATHVIVNRDTEVWSLDYAAMATVRPHIILM